MPGNGFGRRLAVDDARIDRCAGTRYGLKEKLIAGDFHHHEAPIGVEALGYIGRLFQAVQAQLTRIAQNELADSVLRHHPFIQMLMTGEDHVDSIRIEHRFEARSQIEIGPVKFAVRVQRMMKEAELPGRI